MRPPTALPLGAFHPAPMTVCLETSPLVGQTREPGVHPSPEEGSSAWLEAWRPPTPVVILWE